jgi:uncharacterized membrane protein
MLANQINLALHMSMGAVGLICGLVPLFSIKGGSIHRKSGRVFVVLAGVVLGTALIADATLPEPIALLAASLSASYQYISSLRSLALRTHGPSMMDALLACAALLACGWLVRSMGAGTASWSPMVGYSTVSYVACIALYDLSRPLWATYWLAHVRPLDHGLKMTGCYFAMLSSGAGNVLKHLQPWSQVIPSSLGILVMMILLARYFPKRTSVESAI